jgi:hypothetical protein
MNEGIKLIKKFISIILAVVTFLMICPSVSASAQEKIVGSDIIYLEQDRAVFPIRRFWWVGE